MAAREHQGLQIALIVFVIITVSLTVATFMFFSKFKESQERVKQLTTENSQKDAAARSALDESTRVKGYLDPQLEKIEALEETAKKDFEAHGKGLTEAQQNYRALVAALVKDLAGANTRITEITAHEKELTEKLAAEEAASKQAVAEYTQTIAKVTKDLEDERAKFAEFREQMNQEKGELTTKFDDTRKRFDDLSKTTGDQIATLTSDLGEVKKLLEAKNQQEAAQAKANEVPDGKINWVNQRTRVVWINAGSEDGLRPQTAFSVFPATAANPRESERKGKIEVTRIMDAHQAEARILEDDLSDPLMPGDRIFSPTWEPGRPEHFALAGFMDIDGDGASDRDRIRTLITMNGGVIDEEVADDGTRSGKMTVNTKYLVRGEEPKAVEGSAGLAGWNEIIGEAQTLGTKMMPVKEFLDYMGYEPQERTVGLGTQARSVDFKPRLPEGVQRTRPGSDRLRDLRPASPTRLDYQ
jgi:hypothetical protein